MGAALAALSCAEELEAPQTPVKDGEYKTVTFEAVATKTVIDSEGNVEWEAGDEISLYYLKGDGSVADPVIATADAAGAKVAFTAKIPVGDSPEAYYATYPKGAGVLTVAEGVPSFAIKVTADKCDGTFKSANFAVAYSTAEDMSFSFSHAVGMVKVALPKTITRAKDNTLYNVNGIYLRGTNGGDKLQGKMTVTVENDMVASYSAPDGTSNVNMTKLSQSAIESGYAYIPCAPSTWTQGICVKYYSSEGDVPAVLSQNKEIKVERGHILPLADVSSKIIFDYYVSASGDGDGKTPSTPMSIADMIAMVKATNTTQANAYQLRGSTFNFTEGTHNIGSTIALSHNSNVGYRVNIDGNLNAILDASGMNNRVFDITGNATISNLTIQGANVTGASAAADRNGAAVRVGSKTIVTLENLTIQNCTASNGGAIFTQYDSSSTSENSILDCVNCKFLSNSTTGGHGGVIMNAGASAGGQVRFDQCYFGENKVSGSGSNLSGGVLYTVTPVLHMFNKCTFYKNSANTYGQEIYMNDTDTKLAMNNCTFRGASNASPSQGSLISTRGYSIIANTTLWSDGAVGKWGTIGLGSNTSLNDPKGSLVVNCLVYNKAGSTSYPAFYFHNSFNQNVQYCIYTGGTAGVATASVTNSTDLGTGTAITGAGTKAVTTGNDPWYRAYTWPWQDSYNCPTLAQVREIIASNTVIGQTFLDWLDTIEGSLSTDIAGNTRPANAMCPGSYQQENVVANNN